MRIKNLTFISWVNFRCLFVYSTLVFSFIGHMKFDLYVSPLSKKKNYMFPLVNYITTSSVSA